MNTARVDQTLFSTESPDVIWDDIVIGSGMGGMTNAALLSRLGRRVLVLEQHYVPGGFTHTFKRKRWTWDVGVHAVGEVDGRAVTGRVLRALTGGRLEWESLGKVYDEFHFPGGLELGFPDSRAAFVDVLKSAFPGEGAAIDEYFREVKAVSTAMRRYYLSRLVPPAFAGLVDGLVAADANRMLTQRTADVLRRITTNEKLRTVLTAQWGYYGSTPEHSSFAIHALVARHFFHGGNYPKGGSARMADALLQTVKDAGGWTRVKADVKEIVIEDNRAVGVLLADGEFIRAHRVFSAVGALATVTRLLPPAERAQPWAQSIARLRPSPCHVCLYLGFKGDIRQAGASASNQWFYETWSSEKAAWDIEDPSADAPVLYTSFPSLKDPQHEAGQEQLHTGEIVTFVPYEAFARWRDGRWRKRGGDYDALKGRLAERLREQLFRHMPGLRPMLAFEELSTPLSTEHFTRAPGGAIYGLEPTPGRYATRSLRPRTPVGGLFLSASDMATVGVMGAMMGGLLAAVAAEPVPAIRWLRQAALTG